MKKFFSLVLALVMALSLTTVAWGATPNVSSLSELTNAINSGTDVDIVLGGNIEITTSLKITAGQTVNLDLNGYTITGPDDGSANWYAFIIKDGTLVLDDTSANQNGQIFAKCYGVAVSGADAAFIMNGGKIDATTNGTLSACVAVFGGYVEINDGEMVSDVWCITAEGSGGNETEVVINDGDFTVENSTQTYATVIQLGGENNTDGATVEINGGTFTGDVIMETPAENTTAGGSVTGEVSSGSFSSDVSEYLTPGLTLVGGVVKTDISGAKTTYNGLYLKGTNQGAVITANPVSLGYYKANAAKYDKVDGHVTAKGNVAYFLADDLAYGGVYVQVSTLAQADVVAYSDAAGKIVKFYLDDISDATYFEGVVFNNFGEKCGQVDMDPVVGVTYYTVKGDLNEWVYASAEVGVNLMVNGKLVTVDPTPVATAYVGHTIVTEVEDGKLVKVYCSACKLQAAKAPNFASLPTGADIAAQDGNVYWYWPVASGSVSTDKVQSAETFDAGIAMYVGMSVMAATGAVVLKKKD